MTQQKLTKKARLNHSETPSVHRRYCRDCPDSEVHATGSTLWISCQLQSGWRSIESQCNLPQKQEAPD